MRSRTPLRLVPVLLAIAVLGFAARAALAQVSFKPVRLSGRVPVHWALSLDADRAFYPVGASLVARCVLSNATDADAEAWSGSIGGNGCDMRFEILDSAGEVVWEPGSIVNGTFSGPGCAFAQRVQRLTAGSAREFAATIPLVFQNGDENGVLGAPLPAGHYQLAVSVSWIGPVRPPSDFGPGLSYEARLPLLIE